MPLHNSLKLNESRPGDMPLQNSLKLTEMIGFDISKLVKQVTLLVYAQEFRLGSITNMLFF